MFKNLSLRSAFLYKSVCERIKRSLAKFVVDRHRKCPRLCSLANKFPNEDNAVKIKNENTVPLCINRGRVDHWSLVTDKEARDMYGKGTYVIADNVFENVTRPWSISDSDGADFTIENNTARASNTPMIPLYKYDGQYYRLITVIRNNTLSNTGNQLASIVLTFGSLPLFSSVLVQNNTIATGTSTNSRIVHLKVLRSTILPLCLR